MTKIYYFGFLLGVLLSLHSYHVLAMESYPDDYTGTRTINRFEIDIPRALSVRNRLVTNFSIDFRSISLEEPGQFFLPYRVAYRRLPDVPEGYECYQRAILTEQNVRKLIAHINWVEENQGRHKSLPLSLNVIFEGGVVMNPSPELAQYLSFNHFRLNIEDAELELQRLLQDSIAQEELRRIQSSTTQQTQPLYH